MVSITLEELTKINENLIELLKKQKQYHFELKNNLYRFIATDEWDSFVSDPTYCVGSLQDDWESLKTNSDNQVLTDIDLERYAQILRAIQADYSLI